MLDWKRLLACLLILATLGLHAPAAGEAQPYEGYLNSRPSPHSGEALDAVLPGAGAVELTRPGDAAELAVTAPREGLYQIEMTYLPLPARRGNVELQLTLNGEVPFAQAERLVLRRLFEAEGPITHDSRGHDVRPGMLEAQEWQTVRLQDANNHYPDPFLFHLKEGSNEVRLTLLAEAVAVSALRFVPPEALPSYAEYAAAFPDAVTQGEVLVQAEEAGRRNSEVIYALAARGDASLMPSDPVKTRLNTIGGYSWKQQGEWISWGMEVPGDGWYTFGFRALNDFVRGMPAVRRLYLDGKVPFEEAKSLSVPYAVAWQDWTFLDPQGVPYALYLTKGSHEIRLEVAPGANAGPLRRLEDLLSRMNALYRRIIVITGDNADGTRITIDLNRDFHLDRKIPGLLDELAGMAAQLRAEHEEMAAYAGAGSEASLLKQAAVQLDSFIQRPDLIPARLESYKGNLSGLSSWVLYMREQPLQLDWLVLSGKDSPRSARTPGLAERIAFRWRGFVGSFTENYNAVGDIYGPASGKPLQVWVSASDLGATGISSGRDQTRVLKELIDQQFVGEYGIPVNLSLIDGSSTLMQATLGGKGPDVALTVYKELPVNLAMRGALLDLAPYAQEEGVLSRFHESALVPYRYRGGLYALPETQNFDMIFYRADIFAEMGLQVPATWEELRALVPVLQKQGMQLGIPAPTVTNNNTSGFQAQLFQRGLNFYTDTLDRTTFEEKEALDAFKAWTELYTKYSLPIQYDFFSRFRTGEMPLAIAPYTAANLLASAAPELSGLWKLAPIPGTPRGDGSVDRSEGATGTGAIILAATRMPDEAFRFIQWWTSTPVQAQFALALESLMGSAARWPTANREAFLRIRWTGEQQEALLTQWDDVDDIPQLPGNYITNRNLTFAFRAVVYNNRTPREVLNRYNKEINKEIQRKWEEFAR
ncbi:MAG TPA: extracellular solute-binding protein [Candidatus Limnocylindria bacterium]|nr:extracellular solute-binding protein [Candidatus Limnocylindria bacterium]